MATSTNNADKANLKLLVAPSILVTIVACFVTLCFTHGDAVSIEHRSIFIFALAPISVGLVYTFFGVFEQPESYHNFADKRNLCCPNTLDVLSNVPFLVHGLMGSLFLFRSASSFTQNEFYNWSVFFFGCSVTSLGSAYYHWRPTTERLVWDRLPMTICFMSLYSQIIEERIVFIPVLTPLLLVIGVLSIINWVWSKDLRLYVLVQFYPLLTIPLILWLFEPRYANSTYDYLFCLAFYFFAKIAESLDKPIFEATKHMISGHTLKHLLASLSMLKFALMVQSRSA